MASPALLASPIQQLSDGTEGGSWWETGVAMAYSQASKRFLIAWRTLAYGISGRFVDVTGTPISGIIPLAPPTAGAGNRDPAVAWNASTDDFGLVATGWGAGGAVASFRRIRASTAMSGRRRTSDSAGAPSRPRSTSILRTTITSSPGEFIRAR